MNQRLWGISVATSIVYAPLLYLLNFSLSSVMIVVSMAILTFFIGLTHYRIFKIHLLVTALLMSIYTHLSLHWGKGEIQSRLEAAIESPLYEAQEYLMTHWWINDTFVVVYFFCLVFVLWWGKKGEDFVFRFKRTILVSVFSLAIVVWNLFPLPPYNLIDEFIQANGRLKNISTRLSGIGVDDLSGDFEKTLIDYDKIVVIIGESASKKHMSLYGYHRDTTPFLNSLQPVKFDSIAPINQTRYAIPMELTSATVEHYEKFLSSPSLVTIFKHLGYYTYWISNQGKNGIHDSSISSIAKEANNSFFLNDSYIKATLDTHILNHLTTVVNQSKRGKEAYFIHLIGSHDNYDRRYTKEMAKFGEKSVIDQYDNTIYFTDSVISKIYTLFKPTPKLLILYFSDHGELVTHEKSGHGFNPAYQDEYETPLMFYSSVENRHLMSLSQEYKGKVINLESLDEMVKIVLGVRSNKVLSTSDTISVLTPEKKMKFDHLKKTKK